MVTLWKVKNPQVVENSRVSMVGMTGFEPVKIVISCYLLLSAVTVEVLKFQWLQATSLEATVFYPMKKQRKNVT